MYGLSLQHAPKQHRTKPVVLPIEPSHFCLELAKASEACAEAERQFMWRDAEAVRTAQEAEAEAAKAAKAAAKAAKKEAAAEAAKEVKKIKRKERELLARVSEAESGLAHEKA